MRILSPGVSFALLPILAFLLSCGHPARAGATPWNVTGFASLHFIEPEETNHVLAMEGRGELHRGKGFALQCAQDALNSPRLVTISVLFDYFYETARDRNRFRIDYFALSCGCRVRVLGHGTVGLVLSLNGGVGLAGWNDYEGSSEFSEELPGELALPFGLSLEAQLRSVIIEAGYSRREFRDRRYDLDLSSPYVRIGIRQALH